ncbi:MAG: hypothetical protein ACI4IL_06515 [Eubacterium sp.]
MKKAGYVIPCVLLGLLIFMIMANSAAAKQGAIIGIELVLKTIVPSLLPILILTNSIVKSECAYVFDFLFGWFTEKALRLPRQTTSAIIFGLLGGYPAGAILTKGLLDDGQIDRQTARRILRFNFSGGLAFIITAVGTVKLNSTKIGIMLFACCTISSLIIGILQGIFCKSRSLESKRPKKMSVSDGIIESVEQSTKSVLIMGSYIILFSALGEIVKLPCYIMPLLEITNGMFRNNCSMSLGAVAMFLSFGGLCIHFQIFDIIKSASMNFFDFLFFRILGGVLAYFPGKLCTVLFPQEMSVFSNLSVQSASLVQYNTLLSIVLLVGCVVLVCDIKSRKSELI